MRSRDNEQVIVCGSGVQYSLAGVCVVSLHEDVARTGSHSLGAVVKRRAEIIVPFFTGCLLNVDCTMAHSVFRSIRRGSIPGRGNA